MIELERRPELESQEVELGFDFDAWEQELAVSEVDFEALAREAFDGILTLESTDEKPRTIQDVQNDIRTFLSNPDIIALDSMLNQAAMQFAAFCAHNHVDNSSLNGDMQGLKNHGDNIFGHDNHGGHDHGRKDEEADSKTDKKKKKKKKQGWFSFLFED